jgi:hypothetical protein
MAAGLGFKDFTTGEVLTAADVDGYLMQGVWVFASAAARDAAVTSPQEGNFAYLKDTNVTTYYTGSAWANLDTTGMTNPMTTTGDVIYSSSGSTPARLGIGTAGQVLRVNSGATAPEWAAPAGGKVLQVVSATYNTNTSTSSTSFVDSGLSLAITPSSATSKVYAVASVATESTSDAMFVNLVRTSTTLQIAQSKSATQVALSYLDSPATTSATTYKLQYRSFNATAYIFNGNNVGTLTLFEIGA